MLRFFLVQLNLTIRIDKPSIVLKILYVVASTGASYFLNAACHLDVARISTGFFFVLVT